MEPGRLRKLRLEKGYSLAELGKKIGVSKVFISQLERGLREPSMETLRAIARCLDVPTFALFINENDDVLISGNDSDNINDDMCSIVYKKNRKKIRLSEDNAVYEVFTPMSKNNENTQEIVGLFSQQDPGHWFAESMVSHNYDENILILKGIVKAYIGEKIYELREGDNILIKKNSPHNMLNCSNEICSIISYMVKNTGLSI